MLPFVQYMKSADAGSFLDSKNLTKLSVWFRKRYVFVSPKEQVFPACYVQVSRILFHACVAELRFGHTEPVGGELRVGNKFIW